MEKDVLEQLAKRLPMRKPRALSRVIMEMVADGEIPAGTRMPTVRAVADAVGMSTSSVAAAWRELVDWRVLETRRRGGTIVLGPALAPRATRFDIMMKASEGIDLNLGHLTPDRSILPPLDRGLTAALDNPELHEPAPSPISPSLNRVIAPQWPFPASHLMATHGGIDAVKLALESTVRPGDKVIVDAPTLSRVLDILEALGARPVPVHWSDGGPDLAALKSAISARPAAMFYQPMGSYPTGRTVSADWIDEAAQLLSGCRMPVIELVQTPFLNSRPWHTLGAHLPRIVVHIHAYNFFFGADLRVGIAGGSDYYLDRMWQKLTFSSRWVSRILQDALAFQLSDPDALDALEAFIETCQRRQTDMIAALRQVGFDLPDTPGPPIWIPVEDEYVVTNQLSSRGIVVHPGSYFYPRDHPGPDHVLINGTILDTGQDRFARMLANASSMGRAGWQGFGTG